MAGYTKLFADIVTSTIWQAPNDARVLWISMLALKGKDNICRATVPALAKMCDLTLETCEKFLALFQQPDRYSRSQEHEGRRIQAVDGGFLILNGEKYQNLLRQDDRKEYVRQKVAEHRARKRAVKSVTESKRVSSSSPDISPSPDQAPDTDITTSSRDSEPSEITNSILRFCPPDLAADLRPIWTEIAKDHSPLVATKARDACKRIHGAVTPARMRETFAAAYQAKVVASPVEDWPDFRTQIKNDKAGLTGADKNGLSPEDRAAYQRKMKNAIHIK